MSESRGHKRDERDAFALAEMLRTDAVKTAVYEHTGAFASLRLLVKAHTAAVRDTVRTQNRLKALFRSHGVEMSGTKPYNARGLNFNHDDLPKAVFKGAATTVIVQHKEHPLRAGYQHPIDSGTKPPLAKVTPARRIAATALSMWKKGESLRCGEDEARVVGSCLGGRVVRVSCGFERRSQRSQETGLGPEESIHWSDGHVLRRDRDAVDWSPQG